MPALPLKFIREDLRCDYKVFRCFVETGTYLGETIFGMEPHFDQLYTIEIKEELYLNTKRRYHGNKIEFLLGDSSKVLKTLCRRLESPTIFFLDGHWSAGKTGRGEKDCPLYEELESIMGEFIFDAVVIIDDIRLFGKGPKKGNEVCDWESIAVEDIFTLVKSRLTEHYFMPSHFDPCDRLVLHLRGAQ